MQYFENFWNDVNPHSNGWFFMLSMNTRCNLTHCSARFALWKTVSDIGWLVNENTPIHAVLSDLKTLTMEASQGDAHAGNHGNRLWFQDFISVSKLHQRARCHICLSHGPYRIHSTIFSPVSCGARQSVEQSSVTLNRVISKQEFCEPSCAVQSHFVALPTMIFSQTYQFNGKFDDSKTKTTINFELLLDIRKRSHTLATQSGKKKKKYDGGDRIPVAGENLVERQFPFLFVCHFDQF